MAKKRFKKSYFERFLIFFEKNFPKNFVNWKSRRTFALAFGKRPGLRFRVHVRARPPEVNEEFFDRLRTSEKETIIAVPSRVGRIACGRCIGTA
ncbi:MAG: hypothetical protein IJ693_00045 [Bacteroidaceae bacterium]|nr:hypothetical protein [Bacteroidaceae bacterium]